ncbi:hypothetical protein B0187_02350 [Haemophilus paracuniculus]|uniref:Uncharacterized protein n=1 Tax=Haemophilus paracuniculus TaxID=734 RepID=A0A1T0AUB0_9PAST|nr:hypothetical protein B0187_02350 [Haemophilus paracuniculus]
MKVTITRGRISENFAPYPLLRRVLPPQAGEDLYLLVRIGLRIVEELDLPPLAGEVARSAKGGKSE